MSWLSESEQRVLVTLLHAMLCDAPAFAAKSTLDWAELSYVDVHAATLGRLHGRGLAHTVADQDGVDRPRLTREGVVLASALDRLEESRHA